MSPSSPASACAISPEVLGAEILVPSALRRQVVREIAMAWISRANRLPPFSASSLRVRVLHLVVTNRRMIADARALGVAPALARRMLRVFQSTWGEPPLVSLTYAEQIERVTDLLRSGGAPAWSTTAGWR